MATSDGNQRRGVGPFFLIWAHPPGKEVTDTYQIGDVFPSLEGAMVAATKHAAKGREPYSLEFELLSDEKSNCYYGEAEDGTMYTIHGVLPRWPIN